MPLPVLAVLVVVDVIIWLPPLRVPEDPVEQVTDDDDAGER